MLKLRLLFLAVLGIGASGASLGAQTVAEDVVKGQEIQGIEFKNYVGPHKVIESRLAIQGIGADLGRQVKTGATEADYGRKYRIQRLHDPASDLLSADLLILEAGAGVDHIRNLNWILSAYLQQVFGYAVADSDLLASFITRYNAFYRGQLEYIGTHYIPAVAANVTAENAGLALLWSEWPGKTRILIPLRDSLSKGLGGSLNTEEISNQDIVTQMAQEPGAGLQDRKKLADLKEGEIVQEQRAIAQAEAKAAAVPGTPGTTAASPTTTPASGTPATTPSTSPPTTPTLPLEEAKKDLASRDQALQTERQDIVKAETTKPTDTPAPVAAVKPASTTAFVRMNEATKTGQLWLIDPTKNAVWKKSELNTVRQPRAEAFGQGLLVVAGDSRGANGAVRLVLLSKEDASVLATGSDDVLPETALVVSGNQVLALTKGDKGAWVLAAFDTSLKLVTKGTDALLAGTPVVLTSAGLLVQSAAGGILLLDASTLKRKSATEG